MRADDIREQQDIGEFFQQLQEDGLATGEESDIAKQVCHGGRRSLSEVQESVFQRALAEHTRCATCRMPMLVSDALVALRRWDTRCPMCS